jgi:hypothetical protein
VSQRGHFGAIEKDAILALFGLVRQRHHHGHVVPPAARTTTDSTATVFVFVFVFGVIDTVILVLLVVAHSEQQRCIDEARFADKESTRMIQQQ